MVLRMLRIAPVAENVLRETPFSDHRDAALALFAGNRRLTRKAGQFLGQLAVDSTPMTNPQSDWLAKLLERSGLPALVPEDTL